MKTYTVKYKERGKKKGRIYETTCTGPDAKTVMKRERQNLGDKYTLVSCKLDK